MPFPWMLIPAAISAGSALYGAANKPKRPKPFAYPGMRDDVGLAGDLRGYISGLMPSMTQTAPYLQSLNAGTQRTFAGARAGAAEDAATRGIRRSSWDAENMSRLARGESEAMGANIGQAQNLRNQNAGFLSSLFGDLGQVTAGPRQAAGMNFAADQDEYQREQAGREGVLGTLGKMAGGSLAGGLMAPDDMERWRAAIAGGVAPGYLQYLYGGQ